MFLPLCATLCSIAFCFLLSACPNDMYGPDCKLSCNCQNGGVCNRVSGCQCPTGWRGQNCEKSGRCHDTSYSFVCSVSSSFFFFFCPGIFLSNHFLYCSILCLDPCCLFLSSVPCFSPFSDWVPQILDLESHLEWNLNSSPKIFCSATGNPLPSHDSIELRKLDSTVLKVERPTACSKTTYSKPE